MRNYKIISIRQVLANNCRLDPAHYLGLVNKIDILKGKVFEYTNEPYQTSNKSDDIRRARIYYKGGEHTLEQPSWTYGFKIEFNGELIHSSGTYNSMENRLNKLIAKWHLTPLEINVTP